MTIHNNTNLPTETIKLLPYVGRTVNKWRGRTVALYQSPHASDKVISVGLTFDGNTQVISEDDKADWRTALDYIAQGQVYISE